MSGVHFFDPRGIMSLRENGYRDTAFALAELIDNSIQANATRINITLVETIKVRKKATYNISEVLIADNGNGMDKDITSGCLRFGGGTRHGADSGLGKFGFGLPNSSASQCPRFEVYTKQKAGQIYHNYFDFNEILESNSDYLPDVDELDSLPIDFRQLNVDLNPSGTIVKWSDCDKLNYKTASRLVKHISPTIGRIFRHFINDKKVEIEINVYQNNGQRVSKVHGDSITVKPLDPMFLMTDTQLPPPFNQEATNEVWPSDNSDNESHFIEVDEVLDSGETITHRVDYAYSIRKDRSKQEGNSELGQIYRSVMGISVVRAGREISLNDFGFITTIDARHRWWSVEVKFEPISDHLFGLDNSKQNVFNFRNLDRDDTLDVLNNDNLDASFQLMHELSKKLYNGINQMYSEIKSAKPKEKKQKQDKGEFIDDLRPVPNPSPSMKDYSDEEEENVRNWILNRYPSYQEQLDKLDLAVDWFLNKSPFNQYIVFREMGDTDLFSITPLDPKVIIEINLNHEFYQRFILPVFETKDLSKIDPLLILFGSMAQTELEMKEGKVLKSFRSRLGFNLNLHINEWLEEL